jgi:hypothetical protein
VATILYRHFMATGGLVRTVAYMAGGFVLTLILAVVSRLLLRVRRAAQDPGCATVRWLHVCVALTGAIAIVVTELLVFPV